jgi:hypothetical protein
MSKIKGILIGFSIIGLLLGGCGTKADENANEEKKQEQTVQKDEPVSDSKNQQTKDDKTTESKKDENSNNQNKEQSSAVRIMEKNLQNKSNGATKQETAFLVNSSNQKFSLYVLPEYELLAEEPGKDILSLKASKDINMRIELLPDNPDWTAIEENTRKLLKGISANVNTKTGLTIDNGSVEEVVSGDERITAVLIKDKDTPVRLTIYTKVDTDHREAFIEMGKTIVKTK